MKPFKVILADREVMCRQLLELQIHSSPRYLLAASVGELHMLAQLCAEHQPDLVVMDVLDRSSAPGFEIIRQLKAMRHAPRILLMTAAPEYTFPDLAREVGADSFWYKNEQPISILTAMDLTMAGRMVYPQRLPAVPIGLASSEDFTARERDVLRRMLSGRSNRSIAGDLGISEHAVHYHVNNMLAKTGFNSRLELAVTVRTCGFVIPYEIKRKKK